MQPLTDRETTILAIAARTYRHESSREQAAWTELSLTWFAYQQQVNRLLSSEAALAHDPITVHRLQRIRAQRSRVRVA